MIRNIEGIVLEVQLVHERSQMRLVGDAPYQSLLECSASMSTLYLAL